VSLRLWLLGYELLVVPQIQIPHHFRTTSPYKQDGTAFLHNLLRTALVHFSRDRIGRVISEARKRPGFPAALALTVDTDIADRRASLRGRRLRDDDWYFSTFAVPPPRRHQ
jgi:GT2 family glycosyltransferase